MSRIRTFVDSGVLIAAFRVEGELGANALSILAQADRDFVSSDFVRLEVTPKPAYFGRELESQFYQAFFQTAKRFIRTTRVLIEEAQSEAELFGLSGPDAVHIAAARRANCDEFITTERPTRPMFRVDGMQMTSIHPFAA